MVRPRRAVIARTRHTYGHPCHYDRANLAGRDRLGTPTHSISYTTLPAYGLFGRGKFQGYVKARRAGDSQIDHLPAR